MTAKHVQGKAPKAWEPLEGWIVMARRTLVLTFMAAMMLCFAAPLMAFPSMLYPQKRGFLSPCYFYVSEATDGITLLSVDGKERYTLSRPGFAMCAPNMVPATTDTLYFINDRGNWDDGAQTWHFGMDVYQWKFKGDDLKMLFSLPEGYNDSLGTRQFVALGGPAGNRAFLTWGENRPVFLWHERDVKPAALRLFVFQIALGWVGTEYVWGDSPTGTACECIISNPAPDLALHAFDPSTREVRDATIQLPEGGVMRDGRVTVLDLNESRCVLWYTCADLSRHGGNTEDDRSGSRLYFCNVQAATVERCLSMPGCYLACNSGDWVVYRGQSSGKPMLMNWRNGKQLVLDAGLSSCDLEIQVDDAGRPMLLSEKGLLVYDPGTLKVVRQMDIPSSFDQW